MNQRWDRAVMEGRIEEKKCIAINMICNNMDIDNIVMYTGLSKEEVLEIKENILLYKYMDELENIDMMLEKLKPVINQIIFKEKCKTAIKLIRIGISEDIVLNTCNLDINKTKLIKELMNFDVSVDLFNEKLINDIKKYIEKDEDIRGMSDIFQKIAIQGYIEGKLISVVNNILCIQCDITIEEALELINISENEFIKYCEIFIEKVNSYN